MRRSLPAAYHIYGIELTVHSGGYEFFSALKLLIQQFTNDLKIEGFKITVNQMVNFWRGTGKIIQKFIIIQLNISGMDVYWRDTYSCPDPIENKSYFKKTISFLELQVRLMKLYSSENNKDFLRINTIFAIAYQIINDYVSLLPGKVSQIINDY